MKFLFPRRRQEISTSLGSHTPFQVYIKVPREVQGIQTLRMPIRFLSRLYLDWGVSVEASISGLAQLSTDFTSSCLKGICQSSGFLY